MRIIRQLSKLFFRMFYKEHFDGRKKIKIYTRLGLKFFVLKERLIIKLRLPLKLSFYIDFNNQNKQINQPLIDKVIRNYESACREGLERKGPKKLSKQWVDFNENINSLPIKEKIHNFRRNSIYRGGYSAGNILEEKREDIVFHFSDGYNIDQKNVYLEEWKSKRVLERGLKIIEYYHKKARYVNPSILFDLTEDEHGGVIAPVYNGLRITTNLIRFAYYLSKVIDNTKFNYSEPVIACEIGSGYGGLAKLFKTWYPNSTFIMLDLPETLLLASFFIASNFPKARIGYITDFSQKEVLDTERLRQYDFILLPWWYIENLTQETIDIYFNFCSMQEMSKEFINYYFEHIERTCRKGGYFYCENRLRNPLRYGGVPFKDFPFDKSWRILYSQVGQDVAEQIRCRGL